MAQKAWQGTVIKGFIKLLSRLPLSIVRLLATLFAYVVYLLPTATKRTVAQNLATAFPSLAKPQRQQLVRQNLVATSKTFAELGAMWCWPQGKLLPLVKQVSGQEYLEAALQKKRGVIFIAPHTGNWELIGPYLSAQYPCTFLYAPPNVPSVEGFMVDSRGRFGAKLAATDARGVRTLMQALKNNEVTVILPDQDPGKTGGVHANFFGYPARTMTLLSKLIQKTDAVPVGMVMQRQQGISNGFHLHFLPVDEAVASTDAQQATQTLNHLVEQCVNLAPEQYLWSYKRYRKPPAGYANIYKK